MDSVPRKLLEALGVTNQKSGCISLKYFLKEDMEMQVKIYWVRMPMHNRLYEIHLLHLSLTIIL